MSYPMCEQLCLILFVCRIVFVYPIFTLTATLQSTLTEIYKKPSKALGPDGDCQSCFEFLRKSLSQKPVMFNKVHLDQTGFITGRQLASTCCYLFTVI